jgi:hypothetical protein
MTLKNRLVAILALLSSTSSIAEQRKLVPLVASVPVQSGGACYSDAELSRISKAITDLAACRVSFAEQEMFINENLRKYSESGPSFWQEPSFIAGGLIVSFSVGALFGVFGDRLLTKGQH